MPQSATNPAWTIPSDATDVKHLTKLNLPIPSPGPNQVLVKLTAASLNFRDILISTRSSTYPGSHKPNLVPGADGAGIIHSAHATSSWAGKEGTPVVLFPSAWLSGDIRNHFGDKILGGTDVDGTLQGWIAIDDEKVIAAPKGLNGSETSTLMTAGATAWAAIRGQLDAKLDGEVDEYKGVWTERRLEGKWVLTMGTGGVSCFAIQIVTALGGKVIATSSSDSKLDLAKSLGATHTINYSTTTDWDQEVLRITGGKGVDHVLELGGAKSLMKSIASLRPGGLISIIGYLGGMDTIPPEFILQVLFGAKIVKGCTAFSRDTAAEFVKFVEANAIKPVIAQIYNFNQVPEAFQAMLKQNAVGKIVVKVNEE